MSAAPENVWVSIGWVALFLLYAFLAFLNMRGAGRGRRRATGCSRSTSPPRLPMLAGLFAGRAGRPVPVRRRALPFALTAAMLLVKRRGNPA